MKNKLLVYFQWVNNRSANQTELLYTLCDNDFEKLMELAAKMKKHFVSYCPADKEEVDKLLKLEL